MRLALAQAVLLAVAVSWSPAAAAGPTLDAKWRIAARGGEATPSELALTVTIEKNGKVFLGGAKKESEAIPIEEIAAKVKAIAENGYDQRILVRGDKAVDYGTVVQVMGELNAAGFRRIGLVTDPPRGESKKSQ